MSDRTPEGLPIFKKSSDITPEGLPILKKKTLIPDVKSGSPSSLNGLVPSLDSQINIPKNNAPSVLKPKQQAEYIENVAKPFQQKQKKLADSLNEKLFSYEQAQGKGSVDKAYKSIDERNIDRLSDPEHELSFTESVKNTAKNIGDRIEGFVPRLNIAAADTWSNVLGKKLASDWYALEGRDVDEVRRVAYLQLD